MLGEVNFVIITIILRAVYSYRLSTHLLLLLQALSEWIFAVSCCLHLWVYCVDTKLCCSRIFCRKQAISKARVEVYRPCIYSCRSNSSYYTNCKRIKEIAKKELRQDVKISMGAPPPKPIPLAIETSPASPSIKR